MDAGLLPATNIRLEVGYGFIPFHYSPEREHPRLRSLCFIGWGECSPPSALLTESVADYSKPTSLSGARIGMRNLPRSEITSIRITLGSIGLLRFQLHQRGLTPRLHAMNGSLLVRASLYVADERLGVLISESSWRSYQNRLTD